MTSIKTKGILLESDPGRGPDPAELLFQRRKVELHELLVESLNLSVIDELESAQFREEVRQIAVELGHLVAAE